ncbi:MAG: hypothetical protein AB1422_11160 [bacterium]
MAYYSPPYESPIEDKFAYNLVKYLADDITFEAQVEINTICGRFRLDFVASTANGKKVAFECDGKDFHEESRDEWRDAMILGGGEMDTIYRFRGSDITYHLEDLLYFVSRCDPELFSHRGFINLERLSSNESHNMRINADSDHFHITYVNREKNMITIAAIERRHKNIPEGSRQFWQAAYRFASQSGGGSLDSVISAYRSKNI